MGNRLSSDTWLRASDEVIEDLDGVFKLVDDLDHQGQRLRPVSIEARGATQKVQGGRHDTR